MILALLLAAQSQVVGVLEFRDKVPPEQRIDAAYLSDQVRSAAKDLMPQAKVITRENMLVLLAASGRKLEECEGECEVDTGRRLGADLVVSGELLRFGTQYKLNMKLHDTRSGELVSGAVASGAGADDLDKALRPAVEKLLAPIRQEQSQARLSDQRSAAKQALEKEERKFRYKSVSVSAWGLIGYSSIVKPDLVGASNSASGFAYGFGGHLYLHVAGPIYLGAFADFGFLPAVGGGTANGLLAGGGARFDLGDEAALSAGAGYADLSKDGGNGYGLLGAFEYGVWRLQATWRHGISTVVGAVDHPTNAIALQAGLGIHF